MGRKQVKEPCRACRGTGGKDAPKAYYNSKTKQTETKMVWDPCKHCINGFTIVWYDDGKK